VSARITVVGDSLLDRDLEGTVTRVAPDAPVPVLEDPAARSRTGGAALAAALLARGGADVTLVTATGDDAPGAELRALIEASRVRLVDLGLCGPTPEKVRVRAAGHTLVRLDRGCEPSRPGNAHGEALEAIATAGGVLVSDYGRGVTSLGAVRRSLGRVRSHAPVVWDPHPRGADPVRGIAVSTPNRVEMARALRDAPATTPADAARQAARLRERWASESLLATCGADGAVLCSCSAPPLIIPTTRHAGDVCGAGDALAASLVLSLARGSRLGDAAHAAVQAATTFVRNGAAGGLHAPRSVTPTRASPLALAESVRARGGMVVATGGCFDLLHAGHLATLEAARGLGDCLIVCLNSDDSVRALKGSSRPLVAEEDRAAVLESLRCVDAVLVFDELMPERALRTIRPHVWVKGGDYSAASLPESAVLEEWGGVAVVVPYLSGRSTTRLLALARRSA
jgi:rfaE bifunctional protein nucleotidyltransferase chain/domain/rfaE bifunctional protein kinase chain/domain